MAKQVVEPASETTPDEGTARWQRTLWSVWIANLLANFGFSFCMPFLPFYVRDLGVADDRQAAVWAGAAMTAAGLSLTVFSPIWGAVADRIGRKPMLLRAMLGGAVVIAVLGLVQSASQLVALRLLQGAVTGTGAACSSLVASCAPRSRLAYAMGMMQTSVIVGCSVGPWLGGLAADHVGYREPFFFCGGLWLVSGLIVAYGVTERFVRPQPGECNGNGLRQAFGGTGTIAVLSMIFLANFSITFVGPVFPLYVERVATSMAPATATGMLMGVSGASAGLACLLLGHWGHRFSQRRLLVWTSVGSGLLSFPHAVATNIGQLVGLRVGWGLATGGSSPLINSMIGSSVSSASLGRAFGAMSAAQCLGIALGPLAGGFMAAAGGLRVPFVVMGFLLLASGALIAAFVKPGAAPSPLSAVRATEAAPDGFGEQAGFAQPMKVTARVADE